MSLLRLLLRFLSNEVRSESLKIIVHKKNCSSNQDCKITLMDNSTLVNELRSSIIRKAALLEKENKNKKKKKIIFNYGKNKLSSN